MDKDDQGVPVPRQVTEGKFSMENDKIILDANLFLQNISRYDVWYIFKKKEARCDITMIDTCHYTFIRTHLMYTKCEP